MKKIRRKVSLVLILMTLFSLFTGITANAASYPLVIPEEYSQTAYVGSVVNLKYTLFHEYKNEQLDVVVYGPDGYAVAESSKTFYNVNYMTEYTLTWDTGDGDYKPGKYKVVATAHFYTFYNWHTAPTSKTTYVELVDRASALCAKPTLKKLTNTAKGPELTWGAVSKAQSYNVYRKTGSGSWKFLKNTTSTSYVDTSAKAGTSYSYTVRAKNDAGLSKYNSTGLSIKFLSQTTLEKVTNNNSGVGVYWKKVSGASGYYVYRKTGNGSWSKIATVKGNAKVSYLDKTAKSGVVYSYTVKAYNGSSSAASAKSLSIRRLVTPTVASASNTAKGVTVKWKAVNKATGYYVYRKTGSGSWSKIATVKGGSVVSYVDTTAVAGKNYTYTIRAYNGSSSSYFQAGKSVKCLKAPKLVSAKASTGKVTFTWEKATGAAGYYVYRKTGSGSFAKIATVKGNDKVSYVDKTAKKNVTYVYSVRAYSGSSTSSYYPGLSAKAK